MRFKGMEVGGLEDRNLLRFSRLNSVITNWLSSHGLSFTQYYLKLLVPASGTHPVGFILSGADTWLCDDLSESGSGLHASRPAGPSSHQLQFIQKIVLRRHHTQSQDRPPPRVIFQGFTRKEAIEDAMKAVAWETHVVGGVTPGRDGMHPMLDTLPVFLTVSAAVRRLKPDGTAIYGPPDEVAAAIEEASNRGRNSAHCGGHQAHPLIYFMLPIAVEIQASRRQHARHPFAEHALLRWISAVPPASCRDPWESSQKLLHRRGNVVVGTGFVDALDALEQDPDTDSIIVIGDHQGRAEEIAAEWTQDYRNRIGDPK
ncbi:hypothetical protein B0H17DRAFT_1136970 [Mycena rosella]|uniref:CoA-binding domain-containing protein n=1 Tax=Mycena rosella TaxID=1033263 RepID=A0AAD7DCS6_MYCRO|nr:hypothetical protein B0H17DRAFT_1136970 [Mycena rosella]